MTAEKMVARASDDLGLSGRPNHITRWYAARHGSEFLEAPWCDMAVTYWARHSDNAAAVLPNGDRAYTVWHAQDGEKLGRWHPGTAARIKQFARPGALVFFDWGGTDSIGRIDHIGIVERNLGDGRVQTIEGNTGDACKRRVRDSSVIAGFWNPDYGETESWTEAIVRELPLLRQGDQGQHVRTMHYLMIARNVPGLAGVSDSTFTPAHSMGIRDLQKAAGIEVDGVVGPQTWPVLLSVH
ncbi:CHAP domain-containing protein [Thermopolyspora sp. NPDC052614]|uniref:CHAP domain-containing protein n=1 Tax=Thermopolyspora sp. NPDC052614 TaxID=3155682 RepID=UPI003449C9EB